MRKIAFMLFALSTMLVAYTCLAESYKFGIKNTTDTTIVKLLVSETGKTWAPFDIGSGIAPGESGTMLWDESTDDENCEQKVKAVYADGSESEPATFDFCEAGLDLEF